MTMESVLPLTEASQQHPTCVTNLAFHQSAESQILVKYDLEYIIFEVFTYFLLVLRSRF